MARLNNEQIVAELKTKNLTWDEKSPDYQNTNAEIIVVCEKGHSITTNLKTIRMSSFSCPVCVGAGSKGFNKEPISVPTKKGYRIIAFDNATQKMGISIFDSGKLVYYGLMSFNDTDHVKRLNNIRHTLEEIIIPAWSPDFIQFEDVQHQNSYITYEILIKLVGVLEMACDKFGIPYEKTRSSVWRSHHAINGKERNAEKKRAIDLVQKMYQIDVGDDVAEAILIGKYRADLKTREGLKNLF